MEYVTNTTLYKVCTTCRIITVRSMINIYIWYYASPLNTTKLIYRLKRVCI